MTSDDFFALPPFKPDDALVQLRRSLRELRALSERNEGFELRGQPVVQLALGPQGDHLQARLVRQPARSPEWDLRTLRSAADVRDFIDEVKRRLNRWSDE